MSNITQNEIKVIEQSLKDIKAMLARIKKRDNANNSREKARTNGTPIGRKKLRDDKAIHKLRRRGLSIRAIATLEGVSTTAVQRSIKEMGKINA